METNLSRYLLVLRVVHKGPYEFKDDKGRVKYIDVLTPNELLKIDYNRKTRSMLIMGLNQAEYDKISSLKTAKKIWNAHETYHEGSKALREVKLSAIMNDFGNFKLGDGETTKDAQARFQNTINGLQILGKKIPQEEINLKVLSSVPIFYQDKITALESALNVDTMDHLTIFAEME
ncbi:uncharacterized protein LOC141660218 [Apium graveolens]|uniref:uncharacterized protein LOC141660218 n=1 Tax=Apium graveolens TaxID=4045 RepID=UPI003D7954AC